MTNLLELKGISKTFPGVKALSDVDLDLRPGEVLGLCGENGAGKSTLMKVLTGIHKSDPGGEIWLQGEKVDIQSPEHARDLGLSIIHQELNIVPDLTVAQNLYIGRPGTSKFGYVDDRKMVRDARELFERLNMDIDPTAYCRDGRAHGSSDHDRDRVSLRAGARLRVPDDRPDLHHAPHARAHRAHRPHLGPA